MMLIQSTTECGWYKAIGKADAHPKVTTATETSKTSRKKETDCKVKIADPIK